jgi:hypothetical protein
MEKNEKIEFVLCAFDGDACRLCCRHAGALFFVEKRIGRNLLEFGRLSLFNLPSLKRE